MPAPALLSVLADAPAMLERRGRHAAALILYYALLVASVLLLAKATPCSRVAGDGAVERGFKRFACALVLAARIPEIAAGGRPGAAAVLAEWALLETRRALAGAGMSALASASGHVYLVSLGTCFLVLSLRRRQALALVAAKLLVVLLLNVHLLRTISFYHTRSECLGGAALSAAACALRVSACCMLAVRDRACQAAAPISAANAKQTRI